MSSPTSVPVIVRAVARAMGETLKNLFRKPITLHYPEKPRTYPDRYRGLLALTYDKETGEEKVILTALCGHGHFDLAAYDDYLNGRMVDEEVSAERFAAGLQTLPTVPA